MAFAQLFTKLRQRRHVRTCDRKVDIHWRTGAERSQIADRCSHASDGFDQLANLVHLFALSVVAAPGFARIALEQSMPESCERERAFFNFG